MPTVDIYSKQQVDAKIPSADQLVPSTSGASSGDVLTFDGSTVGWAAGGGGGGGSGLTTKDIVTLFSAMCHVAADSGNSVRGRFYCPEDSATNGWSSVECVSRTGAVSTPADFSATFMNTSISVTFMTSFTSSTSITQSGASGKVQGLKYVHYQATFSSGGISVIKQISAVVSYYDD